MSCVTVTLVAALPSDLADAISKIKTQFFSQIEKFYSESEIKQES